MDDLDKMSKVKSKKLKSRSILIGSVVAIIIAITPYIFYTYKSFPSGSTLDTFLFTYESKYQESISVVMWFFMAKFIPLLLLVLWFFTCKHWWYHAILIPIAMFAFQIVSLLYEDRYLDEVEIYWLLPIMMVVIPFVYFIRVKLFDKHVHGIDLEAMEAELKALKKKDNYTAPEVEEEIEERIDLTELSFFDRINYQLSTRKLESYFKQFQHTLQNWMHLKF